MLILRVTGLCVAAAMICAALRVQRPELATAVSLAAGAAVMAALFAEISGSEAAQWLRNLLGDGATSAVLRAAGIALLSEMGAQLCEDAGERALAGRVTLAARIATLTLCVPMLSELRGLLAGMLS